MTVSTLLGLMRAPFLLTRFPDRLNTLSEGTYEAGMARYFLARILRCGKTCWFFFYYSKSVSSWSIGVECRYRLILFTTTCWLDVTLFPMHLISCSQSSMSGGVGSLGSLTSLDCLIGVEYDSSESVSTGRGGSFCCVTVQYSDCPLLALS